jgi:PncC family amidohydrolase
MAGESPKELVRICSGAGLTISVAESCTGGLLSSTITDVPGASACFLGGMTTYSNDAKSSLLGVDPRKISRHGAVSRQVAAAMAERCMDLFGSDLSSAISGIAGPTGGTSRKPVGTVFIAVAGGARRTVSEGFMLGDIGRKRFKAAAVERAIGMMLGRARTIIDGGEVDGIGLSP